MKIKIIKAFFIMTIAVIGSSFGPPVFMKLVGTMDKEIIVLYFLWLGGLLTLILSCFKGLCLDAIKRELKKPSILLRLVFVGLSWPALFLAYIQAMQIRSITETAIIVQLAPLISIFLAVIFLKERVKSWKMVFLGTIFGLIGALVVQGFSNLSLKSFISLFVIVSIFTAIVRALNMVGRTYIYKNNNLTNEFIVGTTMIFGAIGLTIYELFTGKGFILPNNYQFSLIIFLGVITVAVSTYLQLFAYKLIKNLSRIIFIDYLTPVFTGIIAYFLNREAGFNYINLILGFILILTGILIVDKFIERIEIINFKN